MNERPSHARRPRSAAPRSPASTRCAMGTEWTGTASELLGTLGEMAGERVADLKTGHPAVLSSFKRYGETNGGPTR